MRPIKKLLKILSIFAVLPISTFLFFSLTPQITYSANYPLEIIQPLSGLTTQSRFYKAYPGLEYSVKVAAIGGEYPYQYALTMAPSGMTIDTSTGFISWSKPTTSGSPYSVTARVTDSKSTQQSVSWTIIVTTSGFYFLDAVNGSYNLARGGTGTGTISNPWKDMQDFYGGPTNISIQPAAKNDKSYAGGYLYFRSGTYESGAMPAEDTGGCDVRVPFVLDSKPQVWLAYPGDSPTISFKSYAMQFYSDSGNIYTDGIHFRMNGNPMARGLRFSGGSKNNTIIRNIFDGDGMVGNSCSNNAMLMTTGGIGNPGDSERWVISHNTFTDIKGGIGFLAYSTDKVLLEGNLVNGQGGNHSLYAKTENSNWHVRGNKIINSSGNGYLFGGYGYSNGNINVYHNYISMNSGNAVYLNEQWATTTAGPFRVFRNTLVGGVEIKNVTSTNGPWYYTDNVIINGTGGDKLTKTAIDFPTNLIISGTLSATSGLINSDGLLLDAYSGYKGVKGWQFKDGSTPFDGVYVPSASSNIIPPSGFKFKSAQ